MVREDWIWYSASKINSMAWTFGGIENSPIARYVGGFSTNLLRCPSDRFLKLLDQDPRHIDPILVTDQRYRFSYTLNRGRRQTALGSQSPLPAEVPAWMVRDLPLPPLRRDPPAAPPGPGKATPQP